MLDVFSDHGIVASCYYQLEIFTPLWLVLYKLRKSLNRQINILLPLIPIKRKEIFPANSLQLLSNFLIILLLLLKLPEIYSRIEDFHLNFLYLRYEFKILIEYLFRVFAVHVDFLCEEQGELFGHIDEEAIDFL